MQKKTKTYKFFRLIKFLVRVFYFKYTIHGAENLPDEPCIIVGNHAQLHAPIACELYFPDNCYTWCAGEMMKLKEVPSYAYKDFWSQKPKLQRPFFKIASYIIAPLAVVVFNNARTVPVYKNSKIITTFRESVGKLESGNSLVIFPEQDKKHNNIVYAFQEGFVDVAKLYYKRTGKEISFVPLYVAPKLKAMYLGKPIKFSSASSIEEEQKRICSALMGNITDIATSLPRHTVVPYRNIPKKLYPTNIPKETDK